MAQRLNPMDQNQIEEIFVDPLDMAQNLPLFDIMPGLTDSDDSDADSMPDYTDSDSGLDDSMISLMVDCDDDHETPDDLVTDSDSENEADDMKRNVEIVMAQATVTRDAALEALINTHGDILDAINELCPDRDPAMPLLTESDVSTDISDEEDDEYDWTSEDELDDDEKNVQDKSSLNETLNNEVVGLV